MKNIYLIILTIFTLNSCSSTSTVNPSQNSALNSVSKSSEISNKGSMQTNLDNWLKDEWEPSLHKEKKVEEKYSDKSKSFTLQEYVDKSALYLKEYNSTNENSHTQKLQSMPVIGN